MEIAAPFRLALLAVAIATAFLFLPGRAELFRLLRRTRWLLIILFVTYALSLPGIPLWPGPGWVSPTREGVEAGLLRVGRLVLMLMGLAILLATVSRPRLISGLYGLAKPLARLGFDRRAFAVRLGLTLDYVERTPGPANWRESLRTPPPDDSAPVQVKLPLEHWQTRDSAVILATLLLVGIVLA